VIDNSLFGVVSYFIWIICKYLPKDSFHNTVTPSQDFLCINPELENVDGAEYPERRNKSASNLDFSKEKGKVN